ncbi:retrovirus-related pol polyprotein from transposon TNT 1-94 [Tanacetum coccineum]
MTGDRTLLKNFVEKFKGTDRFRNDHFATITCYGDYVQGNVIVCHVYYVEGLGHNLFSIGQFCDDDLEIAFCSKMEGDDLLTGARESNLYTISIFDMAASSHVYLLSKATSTKSWLWHNRLSHLNFDTINDLTKHDLVDGIPKFKYNKYHLCSACEQGKSKKSSHPHKVAPTESMNILSKEDLDNFFRPVYEEYFEKKSSKMSINSAAQQVHNHEDSPLTSSIIIEEHEAAPIVTTSEEKTSSISLNEADEFKQEDSAEFDGNTLLTPYDTPDFSEAESSTTLDPSNMHEFHQVQPSTHICTKSHPLEQIESIQDELHQFERLDVWELVPRPYRKNIIAVTWLWKNKSDVENIVIRNKSRLVAKGYKHEKASILRNHLLLFQPDVFVDLDFPDHVYRLKKALYGLKQAPRAWYDKLSSFLIEYHFTKASRPDIAFATFVCARYQARPTVKHLKEVKRIFQYLRQSYNMGLWYPKDFRFELIAYSDADHAGLSTAEVEYVSLSACCAQVIWITEYQLADLFTKALPKERFEYLVHRIVIIMAQQQNAADVHPDELYPPNKRYDLMDANKKVDLEQVQYRSKYRLTFMLDKKKLSLTLDDFRTIFHLPQANANNHDSFVTQPSFLDMVPFYKQHLGFTMELKTSSSFKTTGLLQPCHSRPESTQGTHRTLSAPRLPNPKMDTAESSAPKRSTVIHFHLPKRRSTCFTPLAPVPTVDKADEMILQDTLQSPGVIRGNKLPPGVRGLTNDKEVEITNDEEVEINNVVKPVNVNEEEEEITDEVYELKRREKGKIIEESRSTPFPTPIRSPRIHIDLVSLDTEKL